MYRAGRVFLQFLAKLENMVVDGACRGIVLVAPHFVQKFVAVDDPVGVLHQKLEGLKLLGRQNHDPAVPLHFHLLEVGGDVVETRDLRIGRARGVAQCGAHTGPAQYLFREGACPLIWNTPSIQRPQMVAAMNKARSAFASSWSRWRSCWSVRFSSLYWWWESSGSSAMSIKPRNRPSKVSSRFHPSRALKWNPINNSWMSAPARTTS